MMMWRLIIMELRTDVSVRMSDWRRRHGTDWRRGRLGVVGTHGASRRMTSMRMTSMGGTIVREEMLRRWNSWWRTWVSLTSMRRSWPHLHVLHPHVDLLLVHPGLLPLLCRQSLGPGHVGGPDCRQVKPGDSARVWDRGGRSRRSWTRSLDRWRLLTSGIHRGLRSHHSLTGGVTARPSRPVGGWSRLNLSRISSVVSEMFWRIPHVIVHIGRRSIISWRSGISLIIVHVLSWILIIARIGLPHHRVGSARSSWRKMLFLLTSSILTSIVRSISLHNSWKVAVLSP